MIKRIANLLIIAVLLALFIFPSRYLCKAADGITALAEHALQATIQEDWDIAYEDMRRMRDQLNDERATMHLFLNHEAVEGLEAAVNGCLRLVQVHDKPQAVLELEFIITRAQHLKSIENFALSVLI